MDQQLISEAIAPTPGSFDATAMSTGAPGFPAQFTWRDREYRLDTILVQWKETGPCTHGSSEKYVRKHWFQIRTTDGTEMKIYCERRPRSGKQKKARWWLYAIVGQH